MICILQEARGTGVKEHLYQRRARSHPEEKTPQDHQLRTEKREGEMSHSVHTGLTSIEYSIAAV